MVMQIQKTTTDNDGDGIIDDNDRTNLGDPIPDATMGLNISIDYKNFDFSAYAFASIGNAGILTSKGEDIGRGDGSAGESCKSDI